jgi:RhtB (resistance to homoserine/threonine) family protein
MGKEFLVVIVAHMLGVVSPGPDLALVLSAASKGGLREGLRTAAGIAVGVAVHVTYCILGIAVLLKSNTALFNAVRIAGSLYLMWLAYKLISSSVAAKRNKIDESSVSTSGFAKGLITNILNPKATLFFLALFTQVISRSTGLFVRTIYGLEMVVATFLWFSCVSLLVGNKKVRVFYEKKSWIVNIVFGLVIGALGLVVLIEVLR